MSEFTVAAAQSASFKGDIERNVARHCEFVATAVELQADFIIFPELSLTGYEPALAAELALDSDPQQPLLDPLRQLAIERGITIVAGCPIRSSEHRPHIGAFIWGPDGCGFYRKRFVHHTEDAHFVGSNDMHVVRCGGRQVAIAICADIENARHAADAIELGANVYAAGAAISNRGIPHTEATMSGYAREYGVITILSNFAADTGGFDIAGRSGIWDASGDVVAQATALGECLVVARGGEGAVVEM